MPTSFPKSKIRAVLLECVHPVARERLEAEGFHVISSDKALEGAALKKAVADAHIVGIRSKTELTADVLAAAPRLLAAGAFCIGTNQIALGDARRAGVAVFNSPFSNTRSVAELTIAEIIALYRRMLDQSAKMHRGDWDKSAAGAHEIRGRTLGIIGYGHIGSQVSVMAEAMGMRVAFYDIIPKLPLGNARPCRTLEELLKIADVLTIHVPATPRTERMVGKAQLKLLQRGSIVINNARGSVVDIPALAAAIKDGHLAGAALDVFPIEPAGKGERFISELQGLPNVILTPHVGGSTEEAQASIAEDVVGKLLAFVNNGSTSGAVNVPVVDLPEQAVDGQRRAFRILHFHRNVPGVLSQINAACAELKVNITGQYLQTREDVGYVVLDIDPVDAARSKRIKHRLEAVGETIRVRVLW